MSDTTERRRPEYNWPEITAVIFSVIAIAISGYSMLEGRWQHRDERNVEVLDAVYEDWVTLALQDDWRVQHLLEAPDTYHVYRDLARLNTKEFDAGQMAETLLVERATANLLFTQFEHLLKQWQIAIELQDDSRQRVLKEEIEFYAEVQLRNPRLLWLWSEDGGGWVHGADPSTKIWYRENVLENPAVPLDVQPDPHGILPGFDPGLVKSR